MPEITVVHDAARAASSGGRKAWTVLVDGAPSLYWCPSEHAARRVASRLRAGRSGEAFGGAGLVLPAGVLATSRGHPAKARGKVVSAGEAVVETVTTKSGRVKPREKRPAFVFELDGKCDERRKFASEQEAKAACACAAFASRGRLGRFAEAEAAFLDAFGKKCKVQVLDLPGSALHGKVVAKDEGGGLWHVGFRSGGGAVKFVQVVGARPGG